MNRTNVNYHFHNPNADGLMEKYILQVLVEQGVKRLLAVVKGDGSDGEENQEEMADSL